MYWILAIKEWKKYWKLNSLIGVQLVLLIVAFFAVFVVIEREASAYVGFNDFFEKNGYFMAVTGFYGNDGANLSDSQKLEKELQKANVESSYRLGSIYEKDGITLEFSTIAYDQGILERLNPEMKEGRWLKATDRTDLVEAVVTENAEGVSVGDILKMQFWVGNMQMEEIQVEIVGVMKQGEKYFGVSGTGSALDYRNLYNIAPNGRVYLFLQKENLDQVGKKLGNENTMTIMDTVFVMYKEGISLEEIEENDRYLMEHSNAYIMQGLPEMRTNGLEYMKGQILKFFPIFLCVLLFAFMTMINTGALTMKMQAENHRVYCYCGLTHKGCVAISLMSRRITGGVALVISSLVGWSLDSISLGIVEWAAVMFLLAVMFPLATLLSWHIVQRKGGLG